MIGLHKSAVWLHCVADYCGEGKKKLTQCGITALGIMKQASREKQMEYVSEWIWKDSGYASPFKFKECCQAKKWSLYQFFVQTLSVWIQKKTSFYVFSQQNDLFPMGLKGKNRMHMKKKEYVSTPDLHHLGQTVTWPSAAGWVTTFALLMRS